MERKLIAPIVWVAALLLELTPIQPRGWAVETGLLVPVNISGRTSLVDEIHQADLDMDGRLEKVSRNGTAARIEAGGKTLWLSPPTWQVNQAAITDLNHDSIPEAALLVWRPFRAWPVDQWLPAGGRIGTFHDAGGNSCQIILIGWKNGKFVEVWAGSALAEPVKTFSAVDLNADGRQELITLENTYAGPRSAPGGSLKVWEWNGFGFSSLSGLEGRFDDLVIARSDRGQLLILVP